MSGSPQRELLQLVEALCEETATAADMARLEELALGDPALLRLYNEAITLHGMLHWDAAGRGAEIRSDADLIALPSNAVRTTPAKLLRPVRSGSPRRWRRIREVATGLAVLVILKLTFAYVRPESPQLARLDPVEESASNAEHAEQLPASSRPGENNESRGRMVPGVRLSRESDESLFSDRRVDDAIVATNPAASASRFELKSDVGMVARINQHLQTGWKQEGLAPAPRADDAEWVRRIYLDLTGRIPTAGESQAFFESQSPSKRSDLVQTLVASRQFSRRLATVWTNLLVGRSRQTEVDRESLLTWLDDEFFARRPWKETVTDLVAARGTSSSNGPANFLLAHLNNEAVPATAITARIFLCEQLQCAQCHQHPVVKSWGQERFWELNAFFQQARISETAVSDPRSGKTRRERSLVDAETFGPTYYETLRGVMRVAYPRFAGVEINEAIDRDHPSLRSQLAQLLFADDHPQPARAFVNRTWGLLMGRGFTFPIDDMGPHTPVSHPELLEDLTAAFVQSDYDVQRLIHWICLSDAYQLSSLPTAGKPGVSSLQVASEDRPLFDVMQTKSMSAEQLFDSLQVASGVDPERLHSTEMQQQREAWLRQFYFAVDTEENSENSTFDGSWQQALMMMNGNLVSQATSPGQGNVLARISADHSLPESDRIRQLSLAALSRYPSQSEMSQVRTALRRVVRQRVSEENLPPQQALAEGLNDLYWAYLNSTEFALIH